MLKLGKPVKEKTSGLKGYLTHMQILGTAEKPIRWYNFQPAALNPEDGTPADRNWVTEDRLEGEEVPTPADLPLNVLGTEAEESMTGFKGTVTAIIVHINGCVHCELQPKGTNKKTGKMNAPYDFDIRMLKGKAIPKLTEQQKEASQRKNPSPMGCGRISLRPQ